MKIMQINITCGRGSTGKLAQSLYEASIQTGYEARFAYSTFTPALKDAFPIETKLQNYLRRGLNRYLGRKQTHSDPGTRRLIRYMKKERPDLIHLHNIQQNSVNYHRLFSFLKDSFIPVVYTLHDCFAITGGCFHFTEKSCDQYTTGCTNCPLTEHPDDITCSSRKAYAAKQELIGNNHRIHPVCVSNWLKTVAHTSYMGNMQHPPITIYNGINTDLFRPSESDIRKIYSIPEDSFMVLSVASFWNDGKGLNMLLDLSKHLPDNAVLVLVGQGLEHITETSVICIPKTENQSQLAQLYSTADVFINASIEETFGLTTAEALACGTPAIVFNSTACPEIVDEHTGLVIKHTDEELLNAVLHIRKTGKSSYTKHCTNRARELFDEKRMVSEYLALYRRILDEEQDRTTAK